MNIDEKNRLWFYYYTEFNLVQTDYYQDKVYDPQISGAECFLIKSDNSEVIFDKGYQNHGNFCVKWFEGEHLSKKTKDCSFTFDNHQIVGRSVFRGSKAVFIDEQSILYYVHW